MKHIKSIPTLTMKGANKAALMILILFPQWKYKAVEFRAGYSDQIHIQSHSAAPLNQRAFSLSSFSGTGLCPLFNWVQTRYLPASWETEALEGYMYVRGYIHASIWKQKINPLWVQHQDYIYSATWVNKNRPAFPQYQ